MKLQKRLAAQILKCSQKRVRLNPEDNEEIKKAITKFDVRNLIKTGAITKVPVKGISKFRARKRKSQKRKGRQRGFGKRGGKASARTQPKKMWIARIRLQRRLLKKLKGKGSISKKDFQLLYKRAKGGFFRSIRHLKLSMEGQELIKKDAKKGILEKPEERQ